MKKREKKIQERREEEKRKRKVKEIRETED
jgi:hypothetical protein